MKITGKAVDTNFDLGYEPPAFHGRRAPRIWIMVIDHGKAQVFYKTASDLELVADAQPDVEERGLDLGNKEVGRNFVPFGHGNRHITDPREGQKKHEEIFFARNLSGWVDEALKRDAFDQLVLVAAPRMLGDMRAQLSDHVRARIIGEIAKDLTNMPLSDIKRTLSNVVYFKE